MEEGGLGQTPGPGVEELVDTSGYLSLYPILSGVLSKGSHRGLTLSPPSHSSFPCFLSVLPSSGMV